MNKNKMDYIYDDKNERVLIEDRQIDCRDKVVTEFVRTRKERGLTQEDVSKVTGISRPNITRFESGKYNPSLELLVRMAAALDMDVEVKFVERKS